jgi:predicted HicB family RNase H-like nuclease
MTEMITATVRVRGDTWQKAAQMAAYREMALSAWVREAIREKLQSDEHERARRATSTTA